MKVNIYNQSNKELKKEISELKKFVKFSVNELNIKDCYFNIIFVNNDYIKDLNKNYRNIDRETDVITFALEDDKTVISKVRVLGDIYISIDKAISQAEEYGHSLKREISFLTIHGILHLLGYDHMNEKDEKKMFSLQDEILNKADIRR
jgi:probable rRNA maturation factor